MDILDTIEFCWKNVAEPSETVFHTHFQHNHILEFDIEVGREKFRNEVETIFRRNGIAYHLTEQGRIERLLDPVLHESLASQSFATGDVELDDLLVKARSKFLDPNPELREEALQHLWDAWERLKTLSGPGKKAVQAKAMLDDTAGLDSPRFRDYLEKEADNLTGIGNNLLIRHWETDRERLAKHEHVDYLFFRMFSLIQLILRTR